MKSSVDDILTNIGNGKFNYLIFFVCSSWGIFGSMQLMVAAFLVPQASYFECQIEEFQPVNWTQEEKRNFSLPWTEAEGYSQCFHFRKNYSNFLPLTFDESQMLTRNDSAEPLEKCSSWIYDTSMAESTLISEWDLVCDHHNLRSLVQSVFMAGVLVSAPLGGYLSDKYGRVPLIIVGFFLYLSSGLLSAFSSTFLMFLISRFVVAISGNFVYLTSYILMLEWCVPRQRSIQGLAFSIPFAVGYMMLPVLAFYLRNWRLLMKTISGLTGLLALNLLVIKESPRWLIRNGRMTKAVEVVNYARKMNRKPKLEPHLLLNQFSHITPKKRSDRKNSTASELADRSLRFWKELNICSSNIETEFRTESNNTVTCFLSLKLVKFGLILILNWFVCNMVYYGLSLSAGNFGVDPFLYMFLGGLMEIPCYIIIVPFVVKYGRRIPLISFFAVCGVIVMSSLALSGKYRSWGFVLLNMIGKLSITSAFQLLYLYSSEIFPTNVRTQGVGITSMVGRLGSILSPIITDVVGNFNWRLPVLIFGCSSLLAGVATAFLPETYEKPLPDTAEDVEEWNLKASTTGNAMEMLTKDEEIDRTNNIEDTNVETGDEDSKILTNMNA